MRRLAKFLAVATVAASLSPAVFADGRNPGSALIYPIHRSGFGADQEGGIYFTVVSVTNSNLVPQNPQSFGGSTNVQFEYVNTVYNHQDPCNPLDCVVIDRTEFLTPADKLSVLTSCHNAAGGQEGYVVVTAHDPSKFKTAWAFNYLMGSELVVTPFGGFYELNAIPFSSPVAEGEETDLDGDGQLDFDGAEYEGVPDHLYIDHFVAVFSSSLALINLTGGKKFQATIKFDAWNDNEFPLSATKHFTCWMEEPLEDISLIFQNRFLRDNTPNDPRDLDIDCDGDDDIETVWAKITGLVASSNVESIANPAILGSLTSGLGSVFDGGRLLWESPEKQFNGDFLKFGSDDPEN